MVRTQIQLTEAQMESLRAISVRTRLSIAELVRRGVEHVVQAASEPTEAERRQRARASFGRFRSGLTDLASRHDDYLADAFRDDGNL